VGRALSDPAYRARLGPEADSRLEGSFVTLMYGQRTTSSPKFGSLIPAPSLSRLPSCAEPFRHGGNQEPADNGHCSSTFGRSGKRREQDLGARGLESAAERPSARGLPSGWASLHPEPCYAPSGDVSQWLVNVVPQWPVAASNGLWSMLCIVLLVLPCWV
jgi:hypothetical protein